MRTIITALVVVSVRGWSGGERQWQREAARDYEPYVFAAVPLHAPVPVLHVLAPAPLRPAATAPRVYASAVQHTPYTRPYTEPSPHHSTPYAETRPYVDTRTYPAESRPYADHRPYSEVRQYLNSRPYRPYLNVVELEETAGSDYGRAAPHKAPQRPLPSPEYSTDYDAYAVQVYPSPGPRVALAKPQAATASYETDSQEAPTVLYARPSLAGGYTYRKISAKNSPKKASYTGTSKEQPVIVKIHKHRIIKS